MSHNPTVSGGEPSQLVGPESTCLSSTTISENLVPSNVLFACTSTFETEHSLPNTIDWNIMLSYYFQQHSTPTQNNVCLWSSVPDVFTELSTMRSISWVTKNHFQLKLLFPHAYAVFNVMLYHCFVHLTSELHSIFIKLEKPLCARLMTDFLHSLFHQLTKTNSFKPSAKTDLCVIKSDTPVFLTSYMIRPDLYPLVYWIANCGNFCQIPIQKKAYALSLHHLVSLRRKVTPHL